MTTTTYGLIGAGGNPLINIPTPADEADPAITATVDGNGFRAAWTTGNATIQTRLADVDGIAVGPEADATAGLPQFEHEASIATLHNGSYVVATSDDDANGRQFVHVRLLGADG